MPTARPIIVTMFSTNRLKLKSCPTSATSPSATMTAASARTMGTTAATTDANTTTSTTSATPMPAISPFARSSSAIFVTSASRTPSPATCTVKPSVREDAAASRRLAIVASEGSVSSTGTSAVRRSSETRLAACSGERSTRS